MRRFMVALCAVLTVCLFVSVASAQTPAQTRPAEPVRVAPGDEIKLDESGSLKASAVQSRMAAILANLALLQRQFQDLQTEWNKSLEERKKLLEESARKSRVELRDPTEWVYDEAGHRYVRSPKKP
ncbi:MAG: hypothetical protein FJZ38_06355 [Candidatus Rokubacteria bacterium]|nr:hypothetical protein [Candidatus Rokubacteria bacterium]